MRWSRFGGIDYGYMKARTHLPSRIRKAADNILYSEVLTKKQIEDMTRLGESLGLKKKEVYAATNLPIDNIASVGRGRITLFGVIVSIIIIVGISFGIALLMNFGQFFDPTPTYTYTPGTRYGSISPNDFTNST
ncbi:MAG: hypothetical protein KAR03_12215 [Candidatus Thorarchaeota archaeon]|nr:hypothetical protein [Candidatus Thorarchaeota archaeon]